MSKKAFMRSIEAIIAIMLFIGFYNVATQSLDPQIPRPDPTLPTRELLNSLDEAGILTEQINTYSLKELSNNIKYLLSPNKGFKIELSYLEPISLVNNNNNQVSRNISFTRLFPENTNLNSVNVFDKDGKLLPTQVINNYYKVKINLQNSQELFNQTITLDNVRLKSEIWERINTTSMIAYVENELTSMELESIVYNNNYYDANATITILIPYIAENSITDLYIFYATNETSEVLTYESLDTGITPPYTITEPEKASASEVIFSITLEPNEEHTALLYYELNTESTRTFNLISKNNPDVNINFRTDYYEATSPLTTYQSTNTFNVRKTVITDDLSCLINMKVWNYE